MSFRTSIILVILAIFTGVFLESVFSDRIINSFYPVRASLIGLPIFALILIALGFFMRMKNLITLLRSYEFAIVILVTITAGTVLGTLVLQMESAETYRDLYGQTITRLIYVLSLDDLYHSIWFMNLFLLLCLSLVLVVAHRWPITKRRAGFFITHLGIVIVVIGALIGNLSGMKGYIDIYENEIIDRINLLRNGAKTGTMHELGFGIKLDRFMIEKYDPEFKIYVYKRDHEKERYNIYKALPVTGDPVKQVKGTGIELKLNKVYPDFFWREEITRKSDSPLNPMLELEPILASGERGKSLWLASNNPERNHYTYADRGFTIQFTWVPLSKSEYLIPAGISPHLIKIFDSGDNLLEQFYVEPDKSYNLEKYHQTIHIRNFYPNFSIDLDTKKAVSKSNEPLNPALEISVEKTKSGETEKRYLFASFPDFSKTHGQDSGSINLVYEFKPDASAAKNKVFLIGSTGEWLHVQDGKIVEKGELVVGGSIELTGLGPVLRITQLIPEASVEKIPDTRSEKMVLPALDVTILTPEEKKDVFLRADEPNPVYLMGNFALVFEQKQNDIKDYKSFVSIIENNRKIKDHVLEVNHPMAYRGYKFYQSNYDPEDESYSGIEVVKDPGLPFAYAGFICMVLGLIYVFYVKPRFQNQRGEENVE